MLDTAANSSPFVRCFLVIVYGRVNDILGQNFNAELYREDLRTGGAGGFTFSATVSRALRLNEAKVNGFFFDSVLFLCTRIRVRCGEMGKYSIPESSARKKNIENSHWSVERILDAAGG